MPKPKIAVYNEKGRVGKTPLAMEIVLRHGYNYATNQNRPRADIQKIVPREEFLQVAPNKPFPELDDDFQVVFDLAGELVGYEESILSALTQVDKIIVPVVNESDAITGTAYAIAELKTVSDITADFVFVANMLKTDSEAGEIKAGLSGLLGEDVQVVPIRYSKAFNHQMANGLSIAQLIERGGLYRYSFSRVCRDLDNLMSFLD